MVPSKNTHLPTWKSSPATASCTAGRCSDTASCSRAPGQPRRIMTMTPRAPPSASVGIGERIQQSPAVGVDLGRQLATLGLAARQPPLIDAGRIAFDLLGVDVSGQPGRCGRGQGLQRGP